MFDPANPFASVQNIDSLLVPNAGAPQFPVSFGEDLQGNLYIAYLVTGDVYRIQTASDPNLHIWNVDAAGDWSTAASWTNGQPNASGQTASFLSAISAPRTVNVDATKTVGSVIFNNANGYTLSGAGTLTINNGGSAASIQVESGSHTISAPLSIAAGTQVVKSGPGTLTISGPQSHAAGAILTASAGLTNLNSDGGPNLSVQANAATNFGSSQHLAALSIGSGAIAKVIIGSNKLLVTDSFTIAGGSTPTGKLDLQDNGLVINYTGATPLATVRQQIIAGYGPGKDWTGLTGIGSSLGTSNGLAVGIAEASDFNLTNFAGQAVDSTTLVARLTRYGDANLDGITDFSDLGRLLQNYNKSGDWSKGDGNYDGIVDFADLGLLLNNYNKSVPVLNGIEANLRTVPEPNNSTLAMFGILGLVLARQLFHNQTAAQRCSASRPPYPSPPQ
jgi:hypothetical protein